MKVAFHTLGCKVNSYESQAMLNMFEEAGYQEVDFKEEADVYVINTCTVTNTGDSKSRQMIRKAIRKNPAATICVVGCYSQVAPQDIEAIDGVSIILGTQFRNEIVNLVEQFQETHERIVKVSEVKQLRKFEDLNIDRFLHTRAYLKIQDGCNNFCTYCIVPYTRGRERSRDIESILNEIRDMHEKGFKEVTLLGQNVNSYSFEKEGETITFPILLDRVAKEVPDMRIRFTTSHPKDMSDDTLRVIAANDNICKFIHLPAQSGSSRILKVMNRKYTREWYLDRIAAIRRIVPDCAISTDLFCGFHSETEEDYQETLSLMREVGYDSAFLFKYSERPGTYAASHLEDNVPEEEKVRRLQGMIDLQNKLSEESNLRDIGKTFEVLIEGFSKRSREQLFGRTSQNKVVIFDKKNYHVGQFIKVKIHKASSATLFGEPVEE